MNNIFQPNQIKALLCECSAEPVCIRFTWKISGNLGEIVADRDGNWTVYLNLYYISEKKRYPVREQQFTARYQISYVAEYISLGQRAVRGLPDGYLEGLAFCDYIRRAVSGPRISIPVPPSDMNLKTGVPFGPTELFCTVAALKKTLDEFGSTLPEKEYMEWKQMQDTLNLLALLPETAYPYPYLPVNCAIQVVQDLCRLNEKEREKLSAFPTFREHSCLADETLTDLWLRLRETEDPLGRGIALRLFAFTDKAGQAHVMSNKILHALITQAIREFRLSSLRYIQGMDGTMNRMLKDNLLAIEKTGKRLNQAAARYGLKVDCGAIHSTNCIF